MKAFLRRIRNHPGRSLLGLVALALAARLVWFAAGTDTGWQTIASSWHDATLGQIGMPRTRVPLESEPEEQVRFWEAQIQQVLQRSPHDGGRHLAAARLLNEPVRSLHGDIVPWPRHIAQGMSFETYNERWHAYGKGFDSLASPLVLQLAQRATELSPETPDYWRVRALLLFRTDSIEARTPDCLAVLEQAAGQDPDNALYDYLGAIELWQTGARRDYEYPGEFLVVEDRNVFDKGWDRFRRGQNKDRLTAAAQVPMAEFLAETSLSRVDAAQVAAMKTQTFQQIYALRELGRWLAAIANQKARDGDPRAALAVLEQGLHAYGQVDAGEQAAGGSLYLFIDPLHSMLLYQMRELAAEHDPLMTPEEMSRLDKRKLHSLVNQRLKARALQRAAPQGNPRTDFHYQFSALAMLDAQSLFAAMSILGLLLFGAASLLPGRDTTSCQPSLLWQVAIWIACFTATFLVLGVLPAEMLGRDHPPMAIVATAWFLGIGVLAILVRQTIRLCRRFRAGSGRIPVWSMLFVLTLWQMVTAGLLLTLSTALVFGTVMLQPDVVERSGFGVVPAISGNEYRPETWREFSLAVDAGSWQWAIAQWWAYRGHLWAPLLILVSVAGGCLGRAVRSPADGSTAQAAWRPWGRGRSVLLCGGRCAISLSAAALLVYLAVAPIAIRHIERNHAVWLALSTDDGEYWQEIRRAQAEIAADPEAMKQLRDEVIRERDEHIREREQLSEEPQ